MTPEQSVRPPPGGNRPLFPSLGDRLLCESPRRTYCLHPCAVDFVFYCFCGEQPVKGNLPLGQWSRRGGNTVWEKSLSSDSTQHQHPFNADWRQLISRTTQQEPHLTTFSTYFAVFQCFVHHFLLLMWKCGCSVRIQCKEVGFCLNNTLISS